MHLPPIRPAVPPVPPFADAATAPAAPSLTDHDALPAGTRFGEFEIVRVLGVGGFGIVYLAHDHSLERHVALKEYMPVSLAVRGVGQMITVRSENHTETYAMGLRSFVNEARLLARFDHPSLVKVYRFWEDNATAYMVMPYLQGTTLREARRTMAKPPGEAWIRGVLEPMLDALDQLHREGVYHRDIAPDNILIPLEGAPILLDFGAARRVISDRTHALTAILKPSYAPIEQYAEMTNLRQGPWTDLYALGAVMHYLLFGAPPPPATARALQNGQSDPERIAQRVAPGVSAQFIGTVAWMLGVRPSERPQNVAALRAVLANRLPVPAVSNEPVTVPSFMPVRPALQAARGETQIDPTVRLERRDAAAARFDDIEVADDAHEPTRLDATLQSAQAQEPTAPMPHTLVQAPEITAPPMAAGPAADRAPGSADPVQRRRRRVVVAGAAAVGVAALVLWQFIALVGAPRPLTAELAVTGAGTGTAASVPRPASAPASTAAAPSFVASGAEGLTPASSAEDVAVPASMPAPIAPSPIATSARTKPPSLRFSVANEAAINDAASRRITAPSVALEPARPARETLPRKPGTAREACGDRQFLSMALCLDNECETPRFRDGAECTRVLAVKRRRAER